MSPPIDDDRERAAARRFNLARGLPPVSRRIGRDPFGEGDAAARARRLRSVGIALALLAFVALIFLVTMAKIGANIRHG